MRVKTPLTFHQGIDYACIMGVGQTTDSPLAMLYGESQDVEKFGRLFVAAPDLQIAGRAILAWDAAKENDGTGHYDWDMFSNLMGMLSDALKKAEGK